MTSRERLLCAMRRETPDRIPVSPFGLGRLDPDGQVARELIERTDPLISVGVGGQPFWGQAFEVSSESSGDETTTTRRAGEVVFCETVRRTSVTSAKVRFAFRTVDDIDRFLSVAYEPAPIQVDAYLEWESKLGNQGLALAGIPDAICLPASCFSPEDMCLMWADHPEALVRLTAAASERLLAWVDALCAAGVKAFRIIGGEYASTQLGPTGFDALVTPFDRELVRVIHQHGGIAYYHNHGPVRRFYQRFAAIGVDAVDPLEAPPWGDCDLAEAKRELGGKVCLVGNLDDMEILNQRPLDEVRAIARERALAAGPDGFILGGTASGTYGEQGARAFMAMVDVVEEIASG